MNDIQAARALGWASLGIAATEALGQGFVEDELLGIDEHPALMHALALREATSGVTILSQRSLTPTLVAGLWSRVAGDAMDGALLALAAVRTRRPGAFAATAAMVGGIVAADVYYAIKLSRRLADQRRASSRRAGEPHHIANNGNPAVRQGSATGEPASTPEWRPSGTAAPTE